MSFVSCEDWNPTSRKLEATAGVVASIVVLGMAGLVVKEEESSGNNERGSVCVDVALTLRSATWIIFNFICNFGIPFLVSSRVFCEVANELEVHVS